MSRRKVFKVYFPIIIRMKKTGVLLLGMIVIVSLLIGMISAERTCTDSDGGANEFVWGYVEATGQTYLGGNDVCEGGAGTASRVLEYYCSSDTNAKLTTITNSSSGFTDDSVRFTDVIDPTTIYQATITSEGTGLVTVNGKVYTLTYSVSAINPDESYITISGQNYHKRDIVTLEKGRETKSKLIDCPNGCSGGVCKKATGNDATTNIYMCTDSDSGVNFYIPGTTTHGWKSAGGNPSALSADYCTDGDGTYYYTVRDWYCENGYYAGYQDYTCPHKAKYYTPNSGASQCYCICLQDSECPSWYSCTGGICSQTQQCTENWQCTPWSTCTNNQKTRTCTDLNGCGTTTNKPVVSQGCNVSCTESWTCSDWSTCNNNQQTRTCTDSNNCGTTNDKPVLTQTCTSSLNFLLKLSTITNSTSGFTDDIVRFTDVVDSTNMYEATITSEGKGTINIGGKVYSLTYFASINSDESYVKLTDSSGNLIGGNRIYKRGYVAIGNPNSPVNTLLLKLSTITNSTSGFSDDIVRLTDVNSQDLYEATITSEGSGMITISGKVYSLTYSASINSDESYIQLTDSSGNLVGGNRIYKRGYLVIDNPSTPVINLLLKLSTITNSTASFTDDTVRFTDVNTQDSYEATITSEGTGIITLNGKVYSLNYYSPLNIGSENWYIQLTDSSGNLVGGNRIYKRGYVAIGSPNPPANSLLLKVSTITNSTASFTDDSVRFTDVVDSTNMYEATITSEGKGTITLNGKVYEIDYYANEPGNTDNWYIQLKDSSSNVIGGNRIYKRGYALIGESSSSNNSPCETIGLRKSGKYCSSDMVLIDLKKENTNCDNNFECSSNVCVAGKCISEGLIQKVISWFKRMFGG